MAILEKKTYKGLTEETAIQLVKELELFPVHAELTAREIGDGNLNYVFRIASEENSVIIKQALPYAKVVGESWPLTLKRAKIEADALVKHGEYVPAFVPKVFRTDEDLAITIMEDLSHLKIARTGLIEGEYYPNLAKHIGQYLAKTLFHTSDFALHPFEKKRLASAFSNPELCKITEDLVFTDPFFNIDTNDYEPELQSDVEEIWNHTELKIAAAKIKQSFLTEAEALLHGDLHTGSIFASEEETKVIDPEFAFYGPIGFDVGQFFAHLVFQVIVRKGEDREIIVNQIDEVWQEFYSVFSELWKSKGVDPFTKVDGYREVFLAKVFDDAIGVVGCELIRRTIGLSHVKDLDGIEDSAVRLKAKRAALSLGTNLILKKASIKTIKQFITTIEEFTA
ncbi:5-methylthioribose kinase [Cytobacillus horneckiae]|uniref:Methylthioribose kinase n=1 Tax=Cytobacillus horneckiae TaxID=549687 RepID=A0A2N0ZES9_9BACI|nr:S-methyl-5-thioribose kinase [Cytobacillus horneckiae]MBN6889452.1 S-methyl-5-thioribose kinase [Cytobacillus horneckiae]MCM3176863.1 S-methyl-5-thioribose kinase [Cytobacillus horneckiae]MEC1156706.1 S-methyl-5-thioribose kinase [Cytobacillus horneckiae]MED2939073.1 S-methyl-5-thioribose kinase [Cytobacillus horneckiae]PKG28020.1 S-methyl-5-thioribose kinase [Cytobacillus horneckiae]